MPRESREESIPSLQQTRRLYSAVAVRGSFGATPLRRGLASAAGAAQLSAKTLGGIAIAFSFDKGRQDMTRLARFLAASVAAGYMLFSPSAHADSVREAVESGSRAFIAAFLRGDARAVAELYTEEAQVIAPGAPIASGRSAIAAAWQATINTGVKDLTLQTAQVESSGELACETGIVRLVAKDGKVTEGRYVVDRKREGEQWKLHRDIWNSAS